MFLTEMPFFDLQVTFNSKNFLNRRTLRTPKAVKFKSCMPYFDVHTQLCASISCCIFPGGHGKQ